MKVMNHLLLAAGLATLLAPSVGYAAPPDDTLVVGLGTDISTFDPDNVNSRDNANVEKYIFGTLYSVEADGSIKPQLADAYKISDDGLNYTFTLKKGLTCEDGEPLTAEDVAYTFDRANDTAAGYTGNTPGFVLTSIGYKSAKVVDDLNVTLTLGVKSSVNLGMIAEVYIHCKDSYSKMSADQAASHPIGSGSYKLVSWTPGADIILEKVKDPGNFKTIDFRVIPEASTRTAELIAGNVDIITNVAPDQIDAIDNSGAAKVQRVAGTRRMYFGFNMDPSFANTPGGAAIQKKDVRQALQYAVDVPTICKQLLNFDCTRATSMVNDPNGDPDLKPYPYDPDQAEKLLDAAGYPRGADGNRFEIKIQAPRGRYLNDANVALAVGQYLTDIGVKADVELLDWASVYVPLISKHAAGPMFFLGSGGATWSALYDMSDLATVDSGPNYTNWKNPDFFNGWKDIENAKTPEEERTIINRMLKVMYDDSPWLFMYFQPDFYGVSKRINWTARRDEEIDLWDVTLNK